MARDIPPSSDTPRSNQSPRSAWSTPLAVLVAAAIFGYLALPYLSRHVSPSGKLIGSPAPDFTLPVIHGGIKGGSNGGSNGTSAGTDTADVPSRIALHALAGNVVVLDFWASWCKPCVAQSRILSELAPKHAADKVMFVGINTADNLERAEAFAKSHDLPYPSVFDGGEVADAYGAQSLPTLIVIDPEGRIADVNVGVLGPAELEDAIQAAGSARGTGQPAPHL
jgi:thiol-disulfide isomerase/thioredoxin